MKSRLLAALIHLRERVALAVNVHQSAMLSAAAVIGVVGGLGAIAFRWLIGTVHTLFFDGGYQVLGGLGHYYTIVLPAAGGLLVGALTYWGAREARGHGVPEIMEAVTVRGGVIRPRVAVVKSLASAICIGSGGSVGREGPIAQIGAGFGSTLGQVLGIRGDRLRTLVACGAAAGIAATFNAPLAGAFFALEIILADWQVEYFAPVVMSSVIAGVIGRMAFGDMPAFIVPQYYVTNFSQLPMFLLLGLLAGGVGMAFTRLVYWFEDAFERIPVPMWLLPGMGGLLVGVIGLRDSELYGVGYGAIGEALTGTHYTLFALLALLALKVLATGMTIGSGGSGGIFAPSLFIGAMLGGIIGHVNRMLFPGSDVSPGAFALVGMGALFSATSHAPISSTLIVFELTNDYRMILPLMLACGLAVATSRRLFRFSIYNLKLVRRRVHVTLAQDTRLLSRIRVADAMVTDVLTVRPGDMIAHVAALFDTTKHHGFPVIGDDGRLCGIVTLQDVRRAPDPTAPVRAVCAHDLVVAYPDETVNDALRKMGLRHVGRLPVVDPKDPLKLLGLVTRKSVIDAYSRALSAAHTRLEDTARTMRVPH